MAINKFYPTSPDPNITTDSDMTVAKFGHLNKLVEDINAGCGGGGGGTAGLIIEGEGLNSSIRCGVDNQAFGTYGSALSGLANITCNDFTANTWGRNNIAIGCYSSVSGTSNIVCARQSHILSGTNNTIACDATQGAISTQSAYSGNYFQAQNIPALGGIAFGRITAIGCDLTSVWPSGSTFSVTYSYAYGTTGTGSCCYGQFQMANVPVICSEFVDNQTRLYFCYDPTSPSFIANHAICSLNLSGCCVTFSNGYLQKTGTFSDYSTYGAGYHPNVIAGGAFNTITDYTSAATISGGYQNTISGGYGVIAGGLYNYVCNGGQIGGGGNNIAIGSTVSGGYNNKIWQVFGHIGGGSNNIICAAASVIVGGIFNNICNTTSACSFIGGGRSNTINNSSYSTISGGYFKTIANSCMSSISTGFFNCICDSCYSIIGTGQYNKITTNSCYSGILGGKQNCINNFSCTFIVGTCICANRMCTLHVNNLSIMDIPNSSAGLPSKAVWFDSTTCTLKMVP